MQDLEASSSLAWILHHGFVTENQRPIEFDSHRFMIDPMSDDADDIVGIKSAQVGWSVGEILRSIHSAKFDNRNIGYILPTQNVVDDFVKPKVNPLITSNSPIADIVHDDSISLKRVGDRFIYFKGAFSQTAAISFSIDTLVLDEYDRMPDMGVVNTFDSRLQASPHPKRRRFSNPSGIGFGVDMLYTDSNQLHWFVKCESCNHEWFMEWEHENNAHYIDQERKLYICGKCDRPLSDEARRMGRWIAKHPDRERHGYWFSQMMAPWVTASRIIEQYEESSLDFFYNFVLGKAYTPSDLIVNRETLLRATAPSMINRTQVVIGVDQNVSEQIWVAGTPQGIFAHGKAKSWEDIEKMKLMYDAIVVIDPAPYRTMPKILAEKYPDVYLCEFKENIPGLNILEHKGSIIKADRTRLFDLVAKEFVDARLLIREKPSEIEDYIADWSNIYRTTVERPDGHMRSVWLKKENKESDYSLATLYMRVGLSMRMGGEGVLMEPEAIQTAKVTDTIHEDDGLMTSLGNMVKDTLDDLD